MNAKAILVVPVFAILLLILVIAEDGRTGMNQSFA